MVAPLDRRALVEAAPIMFENAKTHCSDRCRAYHACWGFLRLLEVLPSVAHDHIFLLKAFSQMASERRKRILISGAADFGMLSYLIKTYKARGVEPEITMLDLCMTPTLINKWYAARNGIEINAITADIFNYTDEPFDLITTHSFMNGFPAEERRKVTGVWSNLLRDDGKLVTANVIMENAQAEDREGQVRRFDEDGVEELVARVMTAYRSMPDAQSIDADELADMVRAFARNRKVHAVTSVHEFLIPFQDEGFNITYMDQGEKLPAGQDGSHLRFRARLIAEKAPEEAETDA